MGVRVCMRAHALSVVSASVMVCVSVGTFWCVIVCDCQWEGV